MRRYFSAARTSWRPSRRLCEHGFSTYTSFPAWHAQIAISACQWFGVAIEIASICGSSSSRRTSANVRTLPPTSSRRFCRISASTSHNAAIFDVRHARKRLDVILAPAREAAHADADAIVGAEDALRPRDPVTPAVRRRRARLEELSSRYSVVDMAAYLSAANCRYASATPAWTGSPW